MAEHNAVTNLPILKQVVGHDHAVPFFITQEMFGGLPFAIAGGDISAMVNKPVAKPHKHDVDEIYLLISPQPKQAVIEVSINGKNQTYTSPSVIHIPAGVEHQFITKKASKGCYCFGILYPAKDR